MKIAIQCAGKKVSDAGYMQTQAGKRVMFVADPSTAPATDQYIYAGPDDASDDGLSWRVHVARYNEVDRGNPFGLCPAYRLYANNVYRGLVSKYGVEGVYILSAGWGLIRADFLTPQYDITLKANVPSYMRRRKGTGFADFCFLPTDCSDELVFLGGKDYLSLFEALTVTYRGKRHVFYNSAIRPSMKGCNLVRFDTSTRTNWHYECARAMIDGSVHL